jgi:hypothetical protein
MAQKKTANMIFLTDGFALNACDRADDGCRARHELFCGWLRVSRD